jgi:hypothetical protein
VTDSLPVAVTPLRVTSPLFSFCCQACGGLDSSWTPNAGLGGFGVCKSLSYLVGPPRFELGTSCTPSKRASQAAPRPDQGATLDDLLIEAFAVVREAGRRFLNMRHFDVQLIGGMVLHKGKIAEMKTGEGKTLVATLPCYLNALAGKGVHVVTVNDYLAKRDSEWMGRIYKFLGLKVGVIVHDLDDQERKDAYNSDITYGTNNEFGFDYLRDNMKFRIEDCVQRGTTSPSSTKWTPS